MSKKTNNEETEAVSPKPLPLGGASCSASPGPWKSHRGSEDDPDRWIVVADRGTAPYIIATIENGQPGDTLDTEKATADLIAAAPKMFAALQKIAANPGDCDMETGFTSGHVARAAIREALGQNVELVRPLPASAEDELGVNILITVKLCQHSGW